MNREAAAARRSINNMTKRAVTVVVLAIVVIFGSLFGGRAWYNHHQAVAAAHRGAPLITVSTAIAKRETWSPEVQVVGSLEAVEGVQLSSQLAGNVTAIAFKSGQRVKQGELLVQLDDSNQLAQLHADQAREKLAQAAIRRTQDLFQVKAASQADLDTAQADYSSAVAAVENDQATLHKLAITAPFSGILGIRHVSLGQYVAPGTEIVSLQAWDPMHLEFSIPQAEASQLHDGQDVVFSVDALPGKQFHGKVTAIDSRIDPATRNVGVQATLPNHGLLLRPGMYGNVQLSIGAAHDVVSVPNIAISYNTFGNFVYVVTPGENGTEPVVHERSVITGDERNQRVVIEKGLHAGDSVVIAGQSKLHDGARIKINNSILPDNSTP
jgi:membrane fusion protein (multidrug efflux system)